MQDIILYEVQAQVLPEDLLGVRHGDMRSGYNLLEDPEAPKPQRPKQWFKKR
jgi:hypothetical protein